MPEHVVPIGMGREPSHHGSARLPKVISQFGQLCGRDAGVDEQGAGFALDDDGVALDAFALVN